MACVYLTTLQTVPTQRQRRNAHLQDLRLTVFARGGSHVCYWCRRHWGCKRLRCGLCIVCIICIVWNAVFLKKAGWERTRVCCWSWMNYKDGAFRHRALTALWHAYFLPKSNTDLKGQVCMQSEDAVSCETTWLWLLESTDNCLNCSDGLNKLWLVITNHSYKAFFFK